MCRGCSLTSNGEPQTDSYVCIHDKYLDILYKMKELEQNVLWLQDRLDNKKGADNFRRKIIKIRREYAKADRLWGDY